MVGFLFADAIKKIKKAKKLAFLVCRTSQSPNQETQLYYIWNTRTLFCNNG